MKHCSVCEVTISPKRIQCVPGATKCVSCQANFDHNINQHEIPTELLANVEFDRNYSNSDWGW